MKSSVALTLYITCHLGNRANQDAVGRAAIISTPESKLKAIVMPTNEELMIARETLSALKSAGPTEARRQKSRR